MLYRSVGFAGPCGSILSTADDMAKWMNFHLSKGKVDGQIPLIKESLLEECYKPQFSLPSGKPEWSGFVSKPAFPVTEHRASYGFGWYSGTYRGKVSLGFQNIVSFPFRPAINCLFEKGATLNETFRLGKGKKRVK